MHDERLEYLIDRCLDGGLTAEESAELNERILSSPEARRRYWEMARVHALIREWGAEAWGKTGAAEKVVAFSLVRRPSLRWIASLAAAAVVMLSLGGGWWWQHRSVVEESNEFSDEETIAWVPGEHVATLARALGAEWIEPVHGPTAGMRLAPGWLKLRKGTVQVDFLSGARVVIEGPAEFQLIGENEGFCRFGKVKAHVPESAHGFKVGSPKVSLVDLGTEFGMDVPADGNPEVHVFEGSVALSGPVNRQLWQGESVRVESGALRDLAESATTFPDEEDLTRKADAADRQRHAEWREAAQRFATEPTLLAYFRADGAPGESRTLPNLAAQRREGSTDATLVGLGWSEGRWPRSRALEFTSPADRVRFHVPGEVAAFTLAAWIRVDSLPNKRCGLLFPSLPRAREIQWSLTRGGEQFLAIGHEGPPKRVFDSSVSGAVVTPMDFGRWTHVACTYDSATGAVVYFKDGRAISSAVLPHKLVARIDSMDFGNWAARPDQPEWGWERMAANGYAVRNFAGRLDEFALLARALTEAEIQSLYHTGELHAPR